MPAWARVACRSWAHRRRSKWIDAEMAAVSGAGPDPNLPARPSPSVLALLAQMLVLPFSYQF